ncbi:hypothetical protein ACV07N_14895 [Roseivirga echinicomitans]
MKYRILSMIVLVVALMVTTTSPSFGQEEQEEAPKNDLRSQWEELIKSSETYLDKKIIRITKLSEYREVLGDSLSNYTHTIEELKGEKDKVAVELSALKQELDAVKAELMSSEKLNDNMSLFGMLLSKSLYSIIVWSIIGLLIVVIIFMMARVKRVYKSAKRIKSSFTQVSEDFRTYQFEAKENQIKLKRELQTALNKLETNR